MAKKAPRSNKKAAKKKTAKKAVTKKAVAKKKAAKKKTAKKKVASKGGTSRAPSVKSSTAAKKKTTRSASVSRKKATPTAAKKKAPSKRTRKTGRSKKPTKKMLKFRDLLVAKHRSLLHTHASTKGNTRVGDSDGTEDYIDYAVSSYDRDFTLSLSELERHQIRLVEEAIRRVDRGDFGRCQECSQEIPEPRLKVEPWARHCIRCQELEEQGLLEDRTFDREEDEDDLDVDDGAVEGEEEAEADDEQSDS